MSGGEERPLTPAERRTLRFGEVAEAAAKLRRRLRVKAQRSEELDAAGNVAKRFDTPTR
jgi:hypothetical protein